MFPTTLSCFLLVMILTSLPLSEALVNITIDDQDSRISYTPLSSWFLDEGLDWDYGGGHMRTEDPNAYATITLKFVSFYVLATKWPYVVTTDIVIDGGEHLLVDMQDHNSDDVGSGPATVPYSVVASWIGTASQEHTLRISIPENGEYAIVDGLIFEALDNDPNITTSSSSPSTTNSANGATSSSSNNDLNITTTSSSPSTTNSANGATSSSSNNSKSQGLSKRLAIVVGVMSAVLSVVLLFLTWWFCIRGRGRNNHTGVPNSGVAPGPLIDDVDYPLDGYDPAPRIVQPAEGYAALPQPRNWAGRQQSLAPSSQQQDGLVGIAQSVVGGLPPRV